jgi:hypothetical protein
MLLDMRERLDAGRATLAVGHTLSHLEIAALHLRKCVELIVLGSFVNNRRAIERVTRALEKKAPEARKVARGVNPEYWPKPKRPAFDGSGGITTVEIHEGFLTEGEWGRAYGFASDVLHVSNPMDPKALWLGTAREALDPIAKELDQWLEKTHELLVHHQVLLAGGEYCLFCSLRGPTGAPVVTLNRKVGG